MEPAPPPRTGGERGHVALAGCHQLPAFVLSPFTASVSPEAATIGPTHGAGIEAGTGWGRGGSRKPGLQSPNCHKNRLFLHGLCFAPCSFK